jgi:flagellar biogenesis protein FliO
MASSRWPLAAVTAAIAAIAVAVAAPAPADAQIRRPKLSIADRGDQVEIVVHDVRLADAPVMKINGDRIELPLAGRPNEVNDVYPRGLVTRIDVRGEGARWMSVKLRRPPGAVAALARGAMARQEDDGVHLFVPKAVAPAAAGAAATAVTPPPEPAAPKKPVGAASGTTVGLAGVTAPAAAAEPPAPEPAPAPAVAAPVEPSPPAPLTGAALSPTADAAPPTGPLTGGDGGSVGFGRIVVAIGAIGLVGLAVVLFRRRRGAAPAAVSQQLEVLASRSLGGKTRVVWLGAGDRELVVAVGPSHSSLLGQWKRGEADRPAAPLAPALEPSRDDGEPSFAAGSVQVARTRTGSSAVSGIMRLRNRVAPITDDAAEPDDERWARDILAGGRR